MMLWIKKNTEDETIAAESRFTQLLEWFAARLPRHSDGGKKRRPWSRKRIAVTVLAGVLLIASCAGGYALFFAQEEREMSREEYFCLVREARRQGMEREAAILQTMASTGVRVSELPFITAEAVRELVEMYSEALSVLDANTVKYMVEQQQEEEIARLKAQLAEEKCGRLTGGRTAD